ncbi:DMT family transporter [Phytoactinopolyspora limicola]|uniref:DMT family transporter n=1 Tax=Phytoactinopolyspora limicola TaxID=2715536 RepID=UPI00140D4715|nr:SMR family transporter [Phytoactinopolyspora limicola]
MKRWALLGSAIVMEVIATLSLRASQDSWLWLITVVLGYLSAFVLLALTLREGMPVGVAYGIWAACGIAAVAILAKFIFNDALTWMMGAGIALIIGGVLIIEFAGGTH